MELGRRALYGRPFGVQFEGPRGGGVRLLPGVALAVVAQLGGSIAREGPERFAVVVEVGGGAVPVRACGRVVGPPAEPVGDSSQVMRAAVRVMVVNMVPAWRLPTAAERLITLSCHVRESVVRGAGVFDSSERSPSKPKCGGIGYAVS
jgi:hypothetical protein